MYQFFSLGFTLHNCWGAFSLAQISAFGFPYPHQHFSCGPFPFLLVRHANHLVETWERGDQEGTAVRQDFNAFPERSYKRTINILRRNSSNAFLFRSAALGKMRVVYYI